jgi:hypothetical protein
LNTLASSTPDTDSDSSVIAVMSESDSWVRPAILPPHPADADLQHHEQGHQRDGDDRQLPAQQQHREERGHHRHDVAEDGAGRLRQHRLHAADVVGQPGLDRPGPGGGEEREVHALQVGEQPPPQIGHDPVAQQRGLVGLVHPDQRGDHRDRHHPADQPGEQREVDRGAVHGEQGAVERGLGQERRDDAQPARRQHRDDDDDQRAAVGGEQGPHAAAEAVTRPGGRRRCGHGAEPGTPPIRRRAAPPPPRLSPG